MKLIEQFSQVAMKTDWRTQYIRYRLGRLKHQYWLWNRKNRDYYMIDEYDYFILKNCQEGRTAFFASAGYYLKEMFPEIVSIETHPVVKTFYSDVVICEDRAELSKIVPYRFDNFAVVNNRGDIWTELENVTAHCLHYTSVMNTGCRFFYSFRDTQISGLNRLTTNMEKHFLEWAKSLGSIGLSLVWHSIRFDKKVADPNGNYDQLENPDTTNGNLKFIFAYKGTPWEIVYD